MDENKRGINKLTSQEIKEIKEFVGIPAKFISEEYGISIDEVNRIRNNPEKKEEKSGS